MVQGQAASGNPWIHLFTGTGVSKAGGKEQYDELMAAKPCKAATNTDLC